MSTVHVGRPLLPNPNAINLDHLMPPSHVIIMLVKAVKASYAKLAISYLAVESRSIEMLA
jgi:hypothetical protein